MFIKFINRTLYKHSGVAYAGRSGEGVTESEFRRVVNTIEKEAHPKRNIALLYCSFGLGLRTKEMASLRIHHVLDTTVTECTPRLLFWCFTFPDWTSKQRISPCVS